jgi:hypothetical protein
MEGWRDAIRMDFEYRILDETRVSPICHLCVNAHGWTFIFCRESCLKRIEGYSTGSLAL